MQVARCLVSRKCTQGVGQTKYGRSQEQADTLGASEKGRS